MIGVYPLHRYPTTFDFAAWVTLAKSSGCDHVIFDVGQGLPGKKYSVDIGWKRFGNILVPLCALAGITYSVQTFGEGSSFSYNWGAVEQFYRQHRRIELLKPTIAPSDSGYVTVTLRESFRNTHRNSDIPEWEKFCNYLTRIGKRVILLGECEQAPLDLEYRMSLYAGAEMNFGVNNGPMSMCCFSEVPYMIFNIFPKRVPTEKTYSVSKMMTRDGFGYGSQFSFRKPNQTLVWEPDDYQVMVNSYELMICDRMAA